MSSPDELDRDAGPGGSSRSEGSGVGASPVREDGVPKLTGQADYAFDVRYPEMLWGAFVRSPHPHASIVEIDASGVERMDGVHAVLTQADFPDRRIGEGIRDRTVLADGRVRFEGQRVAVVAAETRELAERAARRVDVEYEPLRGLVDVEEAFRRDPPVVVHPELQSYETTDVLSPTLEPDRPNVYQHYEIDDGDVRAGFEAADHVYEETYRTPPIDHACMEPQAAVGKPGPSGLVIVTSCQSVHKIERTTAAALDRPPGEVRIVEPYVGGSFGSKEAPLLEPVVGRLAEVTGRPVKIVHSREEEFTGGTVSGEFRTRVKTGVTDDGDVVARDVRALCAGGAYASTGFMVARNASFAAANSYSIPNLHVDVYGVYTTTPVSGAFRGFGTRQLLFPLESQLDDVARDLGLDPVEFRRRNLLSEGEVTALNERRSHVSLPEVLDVAADRRAESGDPSSPSGDELLSGTGIAVVNKHCFAPTTSSAIVRVTPDATVELRYSSDEIGQGNTTVMTQIVSEEFGVDASDVDLVRADTGRTPFDAGSVSSRSVFAMGNAVRAACSDARRKLFESASPLLETAPGDLVLSDMRVSPGDDPSAGIGVEELLADDDSDVGIVGSARWHVDGSDPEPGRIGPVNAFYTDGAVLARVRVDERTGAVDVDELVAIFDVGTAIHPKLVEEQIRGALGMGVGATLYESLEFDASGTTLNPSFGEYGVPTVGERVRDVEAIVLEEHFEEGPYGAKGIGEAPISGVAPAIGNAIRDATGRRVTEIPITPERMYELLQR